MNVINTLRAQLTSNEAEQQTITEAVEAEVRTMTAEEETKMQSLLSDHASITKQLNLLEGSVKARTQTAQPQASTKRAALSVTVGTPWKHFGAYAMDVMKAKNSQDIHQRLVNAASTYGSEGTAADGGYAVPDDLRRDIQSFVMGENSLLTLCDRIPTWSKTLTFPVDTVQPYSDQYLNSGSFDRAEAEAYEENKPNLGTFTVSVGKIGTIINVTDELMEDAVAMGAFVSRKAGERLNWVLNNSILNGAHPNNTPEGILHVPGNLKVVAKETAQTGTNPIVSQNLLKMYYGMAPEDRANGVWLVSPSAEYALATTTFSGSTVLSVPGQVGGGAPGTIFGRPVIVMNQLAALGEEGDIVFANLKKYLIVQKGDVASSVTPYMYWNQDIQSFKFTVRIGGKVWHAPFTLPDGTTRGPFVVLAKRN